MRIECTSPPSAAPAAAAVDAEVEMEVQVTMPRWEGEYYAAAAAISEEGADDDDDDDAVAASTRGMSACGMSVHGAVLKKQEAYMQTCPPRGEIGKPTLCTRIGRGCR
jgi:hypothetical protein